MTFSVAGFIEIAAGLVMLASIGTILLTRVYQGKGIGWRVIQFAALSLTLPTILILALEKAIPAEVTGTLLGSVVGYFFSRGSEAEKTKLPLRSSAK